MRKISKDKIIGERESLPDNSLGLKIQPPEVKVSCFHEFRLLSPSPTVAVVIIAVAVVVVIVAAVVIVVAVAVVVVGVVVVVVAVVVAIERDQVAKNNETK